MRLPSLLLLACLAPALSGQGPGEYLYTLAERGRAFVNATQVEKLPGNYAPQDFTNPAGEQRYTALEVFGPDRYAIRVDGRLYRNGERIANLSLGGGNVPRFWVALHVDDTGVFALRTDGVLARDGAEQDPSPRDGSFYNDLAAVGEQVFMLRFDGAVFVDSAAEPGFQLRGTLPDDPEDPPPENDGQGNARRWIRLVRDPTGDTLLALREDGVVFRIDPADAAVGGDTPDGGTEVVRFNSATVLQHPSRRYVDLELDTDGTIYALRGDGTVYREDEPIAAIVNYPPEQPPERRRFVDLALGDGRQWALRADGQVFVDGDPEPLVDLRKRGYLALGFSEVVPDATNFDDRRPRIARYAAFVREGQALELPVIVADVDEPSGAGLELSLEPGGSTEGLLTLDPEARTVTLSEAAPVGRHRFRVVVREPDTGRERRARFSVRVVAADTDPQKNRAPLIGRVRGVRALVGRELVLPVLLTDRDPEDELVVTLFGGTQGAFAEGAVYDEELGAIRWTPTLRDLGRHKATLLVTDGSRFRRFRTRITVDNPLPVDDG